MPRNFTYHLPLRDGVLANLWRTRPCAKCFTVYPISRFGGNRVSYLRLKGCRPAICGPCQRRDGGTEKNTAYRRTWRAANKERDAQHCRNNYQRNKASIRVRHKKYRAEHPEICRQGWQRYNARKLAVTIGSVNYKAVVLRDERTCYLCGKVCGADLTLDHVVPLSRGGAHSEDNLRVAHKSCNSRKSNRLLSEAAHLF